MTKDIERRILTAGVKLPGLRLRKRGVKRDDGGDGGQKPADTPADTPADSEGGEENKKREDGPGTLEGYAAVFHSEGDPGTEYKLWDDPSFMAVERVARGAFSRAIKDGDDVRGLVNHNADLVIGRTAAGTLRLVEDERGLRFEDDLPDTTVGRDLATVVGRGDVSGCSFGFVVEQESWREEELPDGKRVATRTIESVRLLDVGPVTYPAYASTEVGGRSAGGVLALGSVAEARSSHQRWRDREAGRLSAEAHSRARKIRIAEAELTL